MKKDVFIIDGLRTAVGSPFRSFKNFSAAQMASFVIQELLSLNRIKRHLVNEVILGNAVSAGGGQNIARQSSVLSGLAVTVPAFTVNHVCGAGLQAIILASQSILAEEMHLVIAGGTESASHSPYIVRKNVAENDISSHLIDSLALDGLWCHLSKKKMVELSDFIAQKFGITRKNQDLYSLESHHKAVLAQQEGKFRDEIVPVRISNKKVLDHDERSRKNIRLQDLEDLPAVYAGRGTATAGNSSVPCDGAAAVMVASENFIKKEKRKPKAKILGYAVVAGKPEMVFTAGITAVQKCLKKCGLSIKEIDLFEISEAFATQAILTKRKLKIPEQKMNIYGGDIAIGHPLGTAGTRILVTLLHGLSDQKKKRGLACVCIGGGSAIAIIIEHVT